MSEARLLQCFDECGYQSNLENFEQIVEEEEESAFSSVREVRNSLSDPSGIVNRR